MTLSIYDGLPEVKDLLNSANIVAKKSLGQNFLIDLEVTDRIVQSIPNIENKIIVEIGAGAGTLTRSLLKHNPQKVIAIEIDERAIAIQSQISNHYPDKLKIINKDALTFTYDDYMKITNSKDFYICANLPYNISIPLLINWLYQIFYYKKISGMTLMFQKEVANRITANITNKSDYGRISVLSNFICNTKQLFDVSKNCFYPSPKVLSTVVNFIPLTNFIYNEIDIKKLDFVVKTLFANRRKMIRGIVKDNKIFDELKIDATKRAEDLSILDFCKLSKFF